MNVDWSQGTHLYQAWLAAEASAVAPPAPPALHANQFSQAQKSSGYNEVLAAVRRLAGEGHHAILQALPANDNVIAFVLAIREEPTVRQRAQQVAHSHGMTMNGIVHELATTQFLPTQLQARIQPGAPPRPQPTYPDATSADALGWLRRWQPHDLGPSPFHACGTAPQLQVCAPPQRTGPDPLIALAEKWAHLSPAERIAQSNFRRGLRPLPGDFAKVLAPKLAAQLIQESIRLNPGAGQFHACGSDKTLSLHNGELRETLECIGISKDALTNDELHLIFHLLAEVTKIPEALVRAEWSTFGGTPRPLDATQQNQLALAMRAVVSIIGDLRSC